MLRELGFLSANETTKKGGRGNAHSKRKEHDDDSEPSSRVQSRTRNVVELGPPEEILFPDYVLEDEAHGEGRRRVDPRRRGRIERVREPEWGEDLGC